MSVCQDCEDGRCECGFLKGCEACQFTGVCTSCNGVHDLGLDPHPGFPHVPFSVIGMQPRSLTTMRKCRAQRRRLRGYVSKAKKPEIVMPDLLKLRQANSKSGSCALCNRYHTSGTARGHSDPNSVGYQRGVARFKDAEWCPECIRPFGKKLGRPYAKIGPPPWD